MRTEVSKKLRGQFDEGLRSIAPYFQPAASKVLPAGMRLYQWKSRNSHSAAFLLLFIDPKYDAFSIDLAYATSGEWVPGAGVTGKVGAGPRNGHYSIKLGLLFPGEKFDQWWLEPSPRETSSLVSPSVEKSLDKISSAVEDSLCKIKKYAVSEILRLAALSGDSFAEEG